MIISRHLLLGRRSVSAEVVEEITTHVILYNYFHDCAVYEIMWKSMVEPDRPQMTIWRMRISR
jgi:hypothetical protein